MCIHAVIEITKIDTGETAAFEDTQSIWLNEDGEPNTFLWSDGNYACDCNREALWYRAQGLPEPSTSLCGISRFVVQARDLNTGDIIYDEGCKRWAVMFPPLPPGAIGWEME